MRRWLRWSQYSLWALGLVALGYAGYQVSKAWWSQQQGSLVIQRRAASDAPVAAPVTGGVFGLMEVPRLGLSVVVFEGSDDDVLGRGAGHLPHTASLAGNGNVVLAGHRDTFFRPLRNIRVGDTIKVKTVSAERTYIVESTKIVTPKDIGVLDPTPDPVLTLVTCYPFRYIGPAPDRFIVRAKESVAIPPVTAGAPTPAARRKERRIVTPKRQPQVTAALVSYPVPSPNPEAVVEKEPQRTRVVAMPPHPMPSKPTKRFAPVNAFKKVFHRERKSGS